MAVIINNEQELIDVVNEGGFESKDQFIKFLNIGRLQTEIGAFEVANTVLDAQTGAVRQENEAQKQANNVEIAQRKAILAALVNS